MPPLITVAETPEYIRSAEKLLPAADRMAVFGKNERSNLSKAERNDLAGLVRMLKANVEKTR